MSDIFKLRVDVGTSHIELEGEGTLVHTIFSELREHGLGKLSSINPAKDSLPEEVLPEIQKDTSPDSGKKIPSASTLSTNFPNIRDVVIKNFPKTESEWILVYLYIALSREQKHLLPKIYVKCIMIPIVIQKTGTKTLPRT